MTVREEEEFGPEGEDCPPKPPCDTLETPPGAAGGTTLSSSKGSGRSELLAAHISEQEPQKQLITMAPSACTP